MRSFLRATATLSGLIIGVGIFGVPYVTAHTSIRTGIGWILFLGALVLIVHLLYGEVIAATPGKHRLPGYVGRLFGKTGKRVILVIDVVRFWGLQVAYFIVGGTFLYLLLGERFGGSPLTYSLLLFAGVAISTFFGLRLVSRIEFYLTWLLIGGLIFIISWSLPHIETIHLFTAGQAPWVSPYGVIMVSLAGAAAIPELWDIVGRNKKLFRASIITGTVIPIIITALFAVAIVGVSGDVTSQEAIGGLRPFLGNGVVRIGAFVGFLAIITSYLVIALYLQEALRYDFLVKRTPAWLFAMGVPLLLYFAGAKNFISVIDIVGSLLFGIEGILIVAGAILVIRRVPSSALARNLKIGIAVLAAILLAFGVVQKLWHLR